MNTNKQEAYDIIKKDCKPNGYLVGVDVLSEVPSYLFNVAKNAKKIIIFHNKSVKEQAHDLQKQLESEFAVSVKLELGSRENSPIEDVYRMAKSIEEYAPDVVISFGGGSTIDAVKGSIVVSTLQAGKNFSYDVEPFFGTGIVQSELEKHNKKLTPHVAIQTLSGSAAHLTKYSNISNFTTNQKKLIIDEIIIPEYPVFDYAITKSAPLTTTLDGAFDSFSHLTETLYGATKKETYQKHEKIAVLGTEFILNSLPAMLNHLENIEAREELGLASDLGGYAISIGTTNGGHLTSFSLIDILSHGRACAIMGCYFSVLFANALTTPLKAIANVFNKYGYLSQNYTKYNGRDLALSLSEAIFSFSHKLGFPHSLSEVTGFTDEHVKRIINNAKNPQLKSKLEAMPVPILAEQVDDLFGSILEGAVSGNVDSVKSIKI